MRTLSTNCYDYDRRKKRYVVHTGNYCWHYFQQDRQARAFLVQLSKRYTDRLKDLNEVYRQATNVAQSQLFSMEHLEQYTKAKGYIDDRFTFILQQHTTEHRNSRGNYFHYSILVAICNLLTRYVAYIKENTRHLLNTGQDTTLQNCARTLDVIRIRLHQHLQGRDYTTPAADLSETPLNIPNQLKIAV